jgi:hypothetical protein
MCVCVSVCKRAFVIYVFVFCICVCVCACACACVCVCVRVCVLCLCLLWCWERTFSSTTSLTRYVCVYMYVYIFAYHWKRSTCAILVCVLVRFNEGTARVLALYPSIALCSRVHVFTSRPFLRKSQVYTHTLTHIQKTDTHTCIHIHTHTHTHTQEITEAMVGHLDLSWAGVKVRAMGHPHRPHPVTSPPVTSSPFLPCDTITVITPSHHHLREGSAAGKARGHGARGRWFGPTRVGL